MEDRRVADYFVIAGLPDDPSSLGELSEGGGHLKVSKRIRILSFFTSTFDMILV